MEIQEYLSNQPLDRQNVLTNIHEAIIGNDSTVKPELGLMMGKEMIIYKANGSMKYALASGKNYMSLHALPIYGSTVLHAKYTKLLPRVKVQKGCINFNHEDDVPLEILKELIIDCAPIDLMKLREEYLKSKKAKK
jgi:hypothetical protein